MNAPLTPPRARWRTSEEATLRQSRHLTVMQLAWALRRSPCAVQCKAQALGVKLAPMTPRNCWPVRTIRRARYLRQQGHPVSLISHRLGVPFGTVRRWIYSNP